MSTKAVLHPAVSLSGALALALPNQSRVRRRVAEGADDAVVARLIDLLCSRSRSDRRYTHRLVTADGLVDFPVGNISCS